MADYILTAKGLEYRWFGPGFKGLKWRELPSGKGYWWTDDPELAREVCRLNGGKADEKAEKAWALSAALPGLCRADCSGKSLASGLFPNRVLQGIENLRSRSKHKLFEFQKAGVATALALHVLAKRGTLIGDEMGLGKTVQAIAVARMLKWQSCLIICPAAVIRNWLSELHEWWGRKFFIGQTASGLRTLRCYAHSGHDACTIVSWTSAEKVRAALVGTDLRFDGVIVDEGHMGKNPQAKRTKAVWGNDEYVKGKGMVHRLGLVERTKGGARPLVLTGTPMPNKPIEVQPLLRAVGVPCARDYDDFGARYCLGYSYTGTDDYSGAINLHELHKKLLEAGVVRRELSEVMKDLPDVRLQPILVDPSKKALKVLEKERGLIDPETRAKLTDILALTKSVSFEDISAVRAEMAEAKVEMVVKHLVNLVEDTEGKVPVVVFWHHRMPLELVAEKLSEHKISNVYVHGGIPRGKRDDLIKTFSQKSGPVVFQGTVGTVGIGVNGLQDRSSLCVFADYPWTPGEVLQAIGRLRRIGQKGAVLAQFLAFEGSLDAYVLRLILDKLAVQLKALDGKN